MTRRLIVAMSLIAASVAMALSFPMAALVARSERSSIVNELRVETLGTASLLSSQPRALWPATVAKAPTRAHERVVVVDTKLQLVADSDNSALDRVFNRPEIIAALQGALSSDVRPSTTLGTDLRFVAAPIVQREKVVAAVRFSLPENAVQDAVNRTVRALVLFVLAVTLMAGVIAWLVASGISAPVRALANVAARLHGDLSLRANEKDGPPEVREVATALNDTAERLHDLVRRTERVAADASHHLRTPLTGIRLRLEAIEDMAGEDAPIADEARFAVAEVDRLGRRIEQVLALARTDAGSKVEDVEASHAVLARLEAASPIAEERGIVIEQDIADGLHVLADSGAIPRIVDELLGNALNYARSRVQVRLRDVGRHVELEVADDGPGVPVAEFTTIFERFQRGSGAVKGGSGLGLAMVRETAVACGGGATAHTSGLGGLAVRVTLPRV